MLLPRSPGGLQLSLAGGGELAGGWVHRRGGEVEARAGGSRPPCGIGRVGARGRRRLSLEIYEAIRPVAAAVALRDRIDQAA
jgi:hypothetical protein